MISIVMERGCRNPSAWEGTVGGKLGGKLYIDLSEDGEKFDAGITRLIEEICTITDRQLETVTSQLQQASLRPIAEYPSLPLERYLGQRYFHHINVDYPGLQLVHEEPYIFLVKDVLSAPECEKLMLKIVTNVQKSDQLSPNDAGRTSSSVTARNDELRTPARPHTCPVPRLRASCLAAEASRPAQVECARRLRA